MVALTWDGGDTREGTRKESVYEGKMAHRAGVAFDACPYPHGSTAGNDWRRGWRSELPPPADLLLFLT